MDLTQFQHKNCSIFGRFDGVDYIPSANLRRLTFHLAEDGPHASLIKWECRFLINVLKNAGIRVAWTDGNEAHTGMGIMDGTLR